jgi:hypothetical protein
MKNLLIIIGLFLVGNVGFAQGALLGDLMNVAPVAAAETTDNQESLADYDILYERRKTELDDDLSKLGEDYKKDVGNLIQKFSKVLAKGVAADVKNEKVRVVTGVNSLTIQLRKNKQRAVTEFGNRVAPEIRDLPLDLRQEKQKAMREVSKEYYGNFDEEYAGNQAVITQFKSTEHLTQTDGEGI